MMAYHEVAIDGDEMSRFQIILAGTIITLIVVTIVWMIAAWIAAGALQ